MSTQYSKIIIIGAGVAGLAAAKKLQQLGHDVLILEARDRVGGRIHSIHAAGFTLDLGASWIHGTELNPIWDITEKNKISTAIFNYDDPLFFHLDGKPFSFSENQFFNQMIKRIEDEILNIEDNITAREAIEKFLENLNLDKDFVHHPMTKNTIKHSLLRYFENLSRDPYACELNEISSQYALYEGYFSGNEVIFPQGYTQVVDTLTPELNILFNVHVEHIQTNKHGVRVIDCSGNSYSAQHVICTVPLGVLKQDGIQFSPALPNILKKTINEMGFGVFNKLFFELEESLELIETHQKNSYFFQSSECWLNLLDLSKIYHKPMYLILLGGDHAKKIENFTNHEVWDWLYHAFKATIRKLPAQPKNLWITQWGNDPYSLGSFSYPAVGHHREMAKPFMQPVENHLWFAGEHCHAEYPATVHGAYMSGIQIAEQIARKLKVL